MKEELRVVFRGLNNETGCQVSWHEISLQHMSEETLPSIQQELTVISKLKHDNIVTWMHYWLSKDNKTLIFIADLLPECSLSGYLQKIGTPRTKVVRQWTQQILKGLQYLHSHSPSTVHAYLRPENLYIVPHTGTVKIGGLGKLLIASHLPTTKIGFCKRLEYAAPEVLRGVTVEAADIYSLGICLIAICTGKVPYEECGAPGSVFHHIVTGQKPRALSLINNPDIVDFIEKCLKPLSERPTATQLLESDFFTISPPMASQAIMLKSDAEVPVATPAPMVDITFVLQTPSLPSKKISFAFDLENDTCETVALELIKELNLPSQEALALGRQIGERLYQSFFPQECSTPSTGRESVTESLEDDESREERKYPRREEESPIPSSSDSSSDLPSGLTFSQYPSLRNLRNMRLMETNDRMKSKELRIGAENDEDDVRLVQIALSERFSLSLQANGVYSKKTEALVRRLQEDLDMEVTGVVSPELWGALMDLYHGRSDLPTS